MMAQVLMYCTEVCPYCVRAEQLLQRKGVQEMKRYASICSLNCVWR